MLEENTLFHEEAVQSTERIYKGLQSLAYRELHVLGMTQTISKLQKLVNSR